MPLWFPAIAAGATVAFLGKLLARHLNGQLARSATHDPDGIRTVARFTTTDPERLLVAVAGELARGASYEIANDAIHADGVDIVRLARGSDRFTLTLTRAWTGPQLDADALDLLGDLHRALVRAGARDLMWYARQDRELASPHPHPFY